MKKCYAAADILLPDFQKIDPAKWAVVACDQFTSEPEYWQQAEELVGDAPSTLRMILPEVYLSEAQTRIPKANDTMRDYLAKILTPNTDSMIYVERTQSDGSIRRGIVLAIDLECYDYKKGASSLIRATEATVVERIPPRVAIRRNAVVELPHVMLLIDDADKTVIEPLIGTISDKRIAYDTDLMLGGGHIRGRFLDGAETRRVSRALDELISPKAMEARYGKPGLSPLLFAVGDGNHSLASAKAAYEEIKEQLGAEAAADHPARFALAEVVNIHDNALKFEPIYRVMFGVDPADVLRELNTYARTLRGEAESQTMTYLYGAEQGTLTVLSPVRQLTVGTLQDFIDSYLAKHPGAEVDYIHGEASVKNLCQKKNAIGFLFSGMEKSQLFPTVMFDGALPRKTFSMGHAEDKRYYMECRKITL
ncbi:MAG: DUF1015 domain-containing protein [Clostridia bacterium]|nr:DUF1015 domain-containing protein [Clostridia bacterium]